MHSMEMMHCITWFTMRKSKGYKQKRFHFVTQP